MRMELSNCTKIDAGREADYNSVMWVIDREQIKRLERFLVRHNLAHDFGEEDAAGSR
jgi:hypothetical protein